MISGVEEARLIHLGVLQAVPVFDQQVLLIDIGGGSTEFVLGRAGRVLEARSLKLGTIRLTERFFSNEPLRRSDVDDCRQFVRAYLRPVARELGRRGFEVAVGSSGTILNIAEMVQAQRGGDPVRTLSNFEFTVEELAEVVKALTKAAHRQGAGQGRRPRPRSGPTSSSAAPSCSSRCSPSCGSSA